MARHKSDQGQLFYAFDLEAVVPYDHQVRRIAAVLALSWVRTKLAPHYSHTGRPSIDPKLMTRMLILNKIGPSHLAPDGGYQTIPVAGLNGTGFAADPGLVRLLK